MKFKRIMVGFFAIIFVFGALGIASVFQEADETNAADGDSVAKITFKTSSDYIFEDNSMLIEVTTDREAIETTKMPMFKDNDAYSFVGWKLTALHLAAETAVKHQLTRGQNPETDPYDLIVNEIYEPHEILRTAFYHGDEATFEAVYEAQGTEGTTDIWEQNYGTTIAERIPSISNVGPASNNIIVYRFDGSNFTQLSARGISPDNFRAAMFDIYQDNQPGEDYVIAITGNSTLNLGTAAYSSIGNKNETATNSSDVSFYSLSNRAKSLTITGSASDPVDNTPATSAPTGNALLNFSTTAANGLNFGTNIEFRNIRYRTPFLAANGNSLTLGGGSWGTRATTVYGGAYDGDANAKLGASVTINSTGTGVWNLYGGTRSGNFNGNTNLVINSFSASITTVSGGNESSGVINGNTNLSIYGGRNTITNIYGGVNSGWVTGSAYTKLRAVDSANRPTVTNFYGASNSGIVAGNVETLVAGQGALTSSFYGGSDTGNVGTEGNQNYIKTIFDSSLFTNGNFPWSGGNKTRGFIYANIINTVRAGKTTTTGAIDGFNGSAGDDSVRLGITDGGINSFGIDDSVGRKSYAFNAAKNSSGNALTVITIGNIDSHILGGAFSSGGEEGYAHATGVKGYYEGDAFLTIGILNSDDSRAGGYNYCTSTSGFSNVGDDLAYKVGPSTATNSTTNRTYRRNGWDIFGGTSRAASGTYTSYVSGNTGLIQNNVLARWTYGGGYYGTIDGNTSNKVYGGLIDTLEGGGYYTDRIWGDTLAEMHNGEVNFFFSGGGWNDDQIFGNAIAYCTGGIINCAIGGTYGSAARHTINGNSDVYVTGGNFSGYPSHGTRGFSGGPTNLGRITGNVSLTLDLRGTSGFQLPSGVNITGGQNTNGTTYVGSSFDNTITLNIYTDPGSNVLNGAVIYGDAGDSARTASGHITMNIDAPDSTIGSLYATSYSNISGGRTLLRNVDINVLRAGTIGALSGTGNNTSDNVTNWIYENASAEAKHIDVKLGTELAENPFTGYAVKPTDIPADQKNITFGATGLVNFTSLAVENGFKALAGNGGIKNGRNASATNHYTDYDDFGDVTISDGAGFGVNNDTGILSLGRMTINGEASVYSPPGNGKINLSSLTMNDETARLTWHKQVGGVSQMDSFGDYFGISKAYQVLTFSSNPVNENMSNALTPLNFMGIEDNTGKTFVGDSDTTTGKNLNSAANHRQWGIMIPGSIIDFTVSGDYDPEDLDNRLSAGTGLISHDVTEAKTTLEPPMTAYATQLSGIENGTTKGRLVIPILDENPIYPTLTFNPDDPTGSWIRKGTIDSTKVTNPSYDETIPEQMDLDADRELDPDANIMRWKSVDWTMGANTGSDANEYSYTIDIVFSNEMTLEGKNVIVSESEAKNLTNDSLVRTAQSVFGRPFLTTSLSQADLASLQAGLEGSYSKKIPVKYHVQDHETNPANEAEGTWNIVIVPDTAKISTEKDFAIYANDAKLTPVEADSITQPTLDAKTNAQVIYADNTVNGTAELDAEYLNQIKSAGLEPVPITYTTSYDGGIGERTIDITVNITVEGILTLQSAPTVIDFGVRDITRGAVIEDPTWSEDDLIISDTRSTKSTWYLQAKLTQVLTSDLDSSKTLPDAIYYYRQDNSGRDEPLDTEDQLIASGNIADDETTYNISSEWLGGESAGFKLKVPAGIVRQLGEYQAEITWTLSDTP
ncbi:WxL domain-containing protein [Enterococcus sp. HY326]|uniref:WxL domain-containing protein n=1 Tax=Enterococcus sp. HY326 TaxID=2971265 RepID=UPI00223FBF39|nr:WxL domain-containing protein [Enterococcus sp. HY326]